MDNALTDSVTETNGYAEPEFTFYFGKQNRNYSTHNTNDIVLGLRFDVS